MSITIQLKPEVEARLLAQASKQDVSVEQLLETLIDACVVSFMVRYFIHSQGRLKAI